MVRKSEEWNGVTGGTTLGQKAMKAMLSIFDVRIGYAIMAFIVPFYMLFHNKGYRAIYGYFRRQHGYSPVKAFLKTYHNHFLFGQAMLDRFSVYAGRNKFRVDNPDNPLFLSMLERPEGCIVASAHVGNPELSGYLLGKQQKRINCLIYGGEAKEVQKNRVKILERNNIRAIPVSDDLSHIFLINEALTAGEMVSMPCDRTLGSNKSVTCDFLRGRADFPIGAFVLAQQFSVPVLAMFVLKVSSSLYRIHVRRIPSPTEGTKRERIEAMTRSYARELESIVRRYPEQWFNFYTFWKDENVSRS
jgi:hypothetical protein